MEMYSTVEIETSIRTSIPFVTIIMPICNEAHFIERSLGAVLTQDYPTDCLEVLVVDGMSKDSTRAIVQQAVDKARAAGNNISVALIDNPARIVPTALNIGVQRARGAVIVRVDGHCLIAHDYVHQCVSALARSGADNVGGLQRPAQGSWISQALALATSSPFGVGNARFRYLEQPGWVDTVYLGAFRRDVFARIGGFDEDLVRNQDDEFNFRLAQAGGKIWLDPTIRSVYYGRTDLRSLWRQYYQYGFYKVRVIQKRRAVASLRHLIPAMFVLCLFTSILSALISGRRWLAWSVAGPYVLANSVVSIATARSDFRLLPLTLHFAYGIGFVAGIWRWIVQYSTAHHTRNPSASPTLLSPAHIMDES